MLQSTAALSADPADPSRVPFHPTALRARNFCSISACSAGRTWKPPLGLNVWDWMGSPYTKNNAQFEPLTMYIFVDICIHIYIYYIYTLILEVHRFIVDSTLRYRKTQVLRVFHRPRHVLLPLQKSVLAAIQSSGLTQKRDTRWVPDM